MTVFELNPSPAPISAVSGALWTRDGTASIASQLKSGFNHTVSAMWPADRQLHKSMFIYPVFISSQPDMEEPVKGMPNQYTRGVNKLLPFPEGMVAKGLHSIILFDTLPNSEMKDHTGSMADSLLGPVMPAIPLTRQAFPDLYVIADISLTQYTQQGHAILFDDGTVDNEASVSRVSDVALSFARAGVHCVAPSDMSDGRARAIKLKLIAAQLESKSPSCLTQQNMRAEM